MKKKNLRDTLLSSAKSSDKNFCLGINELKTLFEKKQNAIYLLNNLFKEEVELATFVQISKIVFIKPPKILVDDSINVGSFSDTII